MAAHSKGGTTWSTKLKRISSRSAKEKATVFNNIGHTIDEAFLRDCYHRLDGRKAVGLDGINKVEYGINLTEKLQNLLIKIRRGTYHPQAVKMVEIPKDDGTKRPLAISCIEDKIVQMATSRILSAIYEPIFIPCSYGFREGRSAHDAIKALWKQMQANGRGSIIEIDLRKYFNSVPHKPLSEFLGQKISDGRFLGLINKLIKMPTINEKGDKIKSIEGVPQGSIISPILANIYLHYVIDTWVKDLGEQGHIKGRFEMVRFADDMVFTFEYEDQAERFFKVLPKRIGKYGLSMHLEKSSIQHGGWWSLRDEAPRKLSKPRFKFLGFDVDWVKSQKGQYRPRFRPRRDRLTSRLRGIKNFLWRNLNCRNHMTLLKYLATVVRGWINYFAVSDSGARVRYFIVSVQALIHSWFNRRGGNRYVPWTKIVTILEHAGISEEFHLKPILSRRVRE